MTDDVKPTISGVGAIAGATITVYNNGAIIGTATAAANGTWSLQPENALTEGLHSITATQTVDGNESAQSPALEFEVDITPPVITFAEVSEDNALLTIETEPNVTVIVKDADGNVLKEGQADANGVFEYKPNTPFVKGEILNITAKDKAGNQSDLQTRVGVKEIIAAVDNNIDVKLDATPEKIINSKPSDLDNGGLTVANVGLGPVLGLDVLADVIKNSVQLDVGENQVREVTLHGSAFGVQVVGTMDLYVYKLNETTNEWEQHAVKQNWVVSYLLGGKSEDTSFTLGEGKWMFVMASGEGVQVLTGYKLYFTKDVVLDYNNAESVKGEAHGNMLTDEDPKFGQDELPAGTTLTSVNGQTLNQDEPYRVCRRLFYLS
ncbi:Ig-like domain-containing protein [Acinetobacter pullicarnis]|uniref:Ig-like domain-containing protein n=1 Tax=Acinetobacter pullicarnis TaxID=2576829 RepID=UPI00226596AA|nr:Ig-like domain-containing protein [Acinetobacter pullicarnis]